SHAPRLAVGNALDRRVHPQAEAQERHRRSRAQVARAPRDRVVRVRMRHHRERDGLARVQMEPARRAMQALAGVREQPFSHTAPPRSLHPDPCRAVQPSLLLLGMDNAARIEAAAEGHPTVEGALRAGLSVLCTESQWPLARLTWMEGSSPTQVWSV